LKQDVAYSDPIGAGWFNINIPWEFGMKQTKKMRSRYCSELSHVKLIESGSMAISSMEDEVHRAEWIVAKVIHDWRLISIVFK